ncbi:NACHT domain-containing protein, partial [bacterium]|nr:NACHT domain-containing protein [bacterium]
GDIVFFGKEYKEAGEFFTALKSALPEVVFLPVPGNYDVNRDEVDYEFDSLYDIIDYDKVERFLENSTQIKRKVVPKFKACNDFINKWHPDLYSSNDCYFWVHNDNDRNLSFLGLNSCWACEGDRDQMRIELGYPQIINALDQTDDKANCVALMHHPPVNWLKDFPHGKTAQEMFRNCSLLLHGHSHEDHALVWVQPSESCICLGVNASYTNKKEKGFLGFQFIQLQCESERTVVKVWPYILDGRRNEFVPDRERWENQNGKVYFELSTQLDPVAVGTGAELLPDIPVVYRDWITEFHSKMDIQELSRKGEVITVDLPELYITLKTSNPFYKLELEELRKKRGLKDGDLIPDHVEKEIQLKESPYIDIEELLSRKSCMVLRGPAGTGKTTLVKHLVNTVSRGTSHTNLNNYLPVMVFLKELWPIYSHEVNGSVGVVKFETMLGKYLDATNCPLTMDVITAYLKHHRALFMFDGLDEVPDHLRMDLVNLIHGFWFQHRDNRILLTGRPNGIDQTVMDHYGSDVLDIEPLKEEQISPFISKWFSAVSSQAQGLARDYAKGLISDIQSNEHIQVFTQNPLLLTAVCVLYKDGNRIPDQRADLYSRLVNNLIYRRFKDSRDPGMETKVKEFLMNLAFQMHKRHLKTWGAGDACAILKTSFPCDDSETESDYRHRLKELFETIEPKCGMLNRTSSGEIEFIHLTFQEFLAAKHLGYMGVDFTEYMKDKWWEETILLYAGLMNMEWKADSNKVVQEILDVGTKDLDLRLVLLAGKALHDFQTVLREPKTVDMVRKELYKIMKSDAALEDRFEAGDIVGRLGDLRIRGEDQFVKIERGEFIRGSGENEGYTDERPQRKIYLDEYWIGKYPVTNEEFRKFVS